METGSCFLSDGTCLHRDRNLTLYILGWSLSGVLILFGVYVAFIDKSQQILSRQNLEVSKALATAKRDDAFKAFLVGFSEDEQFILRAVHDQDGIKQSTLRFKTGLSKATLSSLLSSLEENKIVKRKVSGKTKEVYLVKRF